MEIVNEGHHHLTGRSLIISRKAISNHVINNHKTQRIIETILHASQSRCYSEYNAKLSGQ